MLPSPKKTVFTSYNYEILRSFEIQNENCWCLAEMLASQKINRDDMLPVYGIVTDGEVWQFGRLVKDVFTKNRTRFPVDNIDRLFGYHCGQ